MMGIFGLRRVLCVFVVLMGLFVSAVSVAWGSGNGGMWSVTSVASPTNFTPNNSSGKESYVLTAVDTGSGASAGPVVLHDALPAGVSAQSIVGFYLPSRAELSCSVATVSCSFSGVVQPGDELWVDVRVTVGAIAEGTRVSNAVQVSGGGLPEGMGSSETLVSSTKAGFGLAVGSAISTVSSAHAGGHPNFTTGFMFNSEGLNTPTDNVKNVSIGLPPGLVGNPTVMGQCTMADVEVNECPADTAVGVATIMVAGEEEIEPFSILVYNIAPYPNEPAAFGFDVSGIPVRIDVSLHANPQIAGGYEIRVKVGNIIEASEIMGTMVTLWGVPADHSGPGEPEHFIFTTGQDFGGRGGGPELPFLSYATQCSSPVSMGFAVDSWQVPGSETAEGLPVAAGGGWSLANVGLGVPSNCGSLRFEPSLSFAPNSPPVSPGAYQAGAPSGYLSEVRVPQNQSPEAVATPDLKDTSLTLPQGVALSPSAASGLLACSQAQIALLSESAPICPGAASVGGVEIITPLLSQALHGNVYLAEQNANPFGSLFALYLAAEGAGVSVKLAGEVQADPVTGQLTATFKDTPQVPFSDLKLTLNGGARAPLANPTQCGTATSTGLLTPYAGAAASVSSSFDVVGCSSRFAPSFVAGTTSNEAGSFSPLSLTFSRSDQDGDFLGGQFTMPPGVLGNIKGLELCSEAQADEAQTNPHPCPAGSEIGQTTVGSGPGGDPFFLSGKVYITGPYHGAPYGLLITVPAIAGPFNLGIVPVHATVSIDPHTAQLTVTPEAFPTILDGIPLHVKTVNVTITHPNFTFNATSCEPTQVTGKLVSTAGATASVSSPYQAAGCQSLGFSPTMTVKTNGHTSREDGASLIFHLSYPTGSEGTQANVHSVATTLPKQLPARLTTIQKACIDTTFDANPAACPPQSLIGVAIASTPALSGRLSGPVYLVSHGGAAFPDVDIVIQGDGIRVDLTGAINIVKNVTSATFNTVPDVPITGFELILPEGPHSGLAAVGNLCSTPLTMPITVTAQSGRRIKQNLKVNTYNCPKKIKTKKSKKK